MVKNQLLHFTCPTQSDAFKQGFFQGRGSIRPPLALACPPWRFCSDSESIQVF